jgi:hypothetical protein
MDVWTETCWRLRWLRGLIGRLHGLAAGALWSAVALLVLRQLVLLLAMFLPFQVMFMLATRQVSRYLRWAGDAMPFNTLLVALVLATLVLYGLQLLCGHWAAARLTLAASRVLQHGNKLALFKDDQQQARDVVRRLVSWCVAGLLWVLYAALGLQVDAPVFAAVLGVAALHFVLAQQLFRRPKGRRARWLEWLQTYRARASSVWSNSLFFLGFLVLFLQFLHAGQGDVLTAILALLLLRQMTVWLSQWVLGVVSLSALRHRVDALFDPQQHYAPPTAATLNAFLAWLAPNTRDAWMRAALHDVTGLAITGALSFGWNDTGLLGLAAFDVDVIDSDNPRAYFVRCFSQAQRQQADHEARLFESQTPPPMAPVYLGRAHVDGSSVLVFEGLPRQRPAGAELPALRRQLHQACADLVLDAQLVSAYVRTHPTLPHRVDALLIARLRVASSTDVQRELVECFEQALDAIRGHLQGLPCVLENPDVSPAFMRVGEGGPKLWQWQRWRADLFHPHAPWTTPPGRALVTALSVLERAARNGRPAEALGKLPELLALWAQVSGSGASSIECPESQTVKNTT